MEEKKFYDIALVFLSAKGYPDLSIVDGSGDGGRDVTSSWGHIRFQLSVQKDWQKKLNKEATATKRAGRHHFVYITNRRIRDNEREQFIQSEYVERGNVELTIFDLDSIATTLSLPGRIAATYERLGLVVNSKISASPKEIALSSTLLFSKEARELRDNVLEASIKSQLFVTPGIAETQLIEAVAKLYGTDNLAGSAAQALQRLRGMSAVALRGGLLYLSDEATAEIAAAKEDFVQAKTLDVTRLTKTYGISDDQANSLIEVALEILARRGNFDGDNAYEVQLGQLIADNSLSRRRHQLYSDLATLACARVAQYGEALDHIFGTDTFDIFRVLGRNTDVVALLDSSVAMPLLFGLSFSNAHSRYGIGAAALHRMCKAHQISIKVPRPYLNEMATHGKKALEYLAMYNLIGEEPRSVLKSSGNAYISHYSHIREMPEFAGKLSLQQFLSHFGLIREATTWAIENRIENLLGNFNIEVVSMPNWTDEIRRKVAIEKKYDPPVIIDHDATVCTYLRQETNFGFVFATWDNSLTKLVENLSRIYADTPSRVVDFLSMSRAANYESEQTISLLDSLIYCDERKTEALAKKIEGIRSADTAYELQHFADQARQSANASIEPAQLLEPFFHE
ncbi:hypothetical protein [Methyloversatilis discipulorum]|uniref:hypothetical protein n=1 Tax=Methyloversatilis discipulorum TaxID=1119528 RepID=UPI0026EC54DB|nr:hypothetical protein [Methyloversatilis discipulorum]